MWRDPFGMASNDFTPPFWLRPAMVQTALASARVRQRLHRGFDKAARRVVLKGATDVPIPAWINTPRQPKGRVILLHGWLGMPQSGYVLSTAAALYAAGFETVRLTLPDHGEAALLTPRVIDLSRHDVLAAALRDLAAQEGALPFGLVGFSLGGNFSLRLLRDHRHDVVPGLAFALAVSPLISPSETSERIDRNLLIRRYFLRKYYRLSEAKQHAFPDVKGLDGLKDVRRITALTARSVERFTRFESSEAYYDAYHIDTSDLKEVDLPLTMLVAEDDPIVPPQAALRLSLGPRTQRILTRHGGHNGFFSSFPHGAYADTLAVEMAQTHLTARAPL